MKRICKDCGKEFELSSGEIEFYNSKNLTLPKRCKECRDKNKKEDIIQENKSDNAKETNLQEENISQVYRNSTKSKQIGINKKNSLIAAAIVMILAFVRLFTNDLPSSQSDSQINSYEEQQNLYQFRNDEYLTRHFEKHGSEFGYSSKEEYLAGANKVIKSSEALHKIEAEDKDDVYFLEATKELVIVSTDGYIRTYFKPDDGIDYYNRQ